MVLCLQCLPAFHSSPPLAKALNTFLPENNGTGWATGSSKFTVPGMHTTQVHVALGTTHQNLALGIKHKFMDQGNNRYKAKEET